MILVSIAGIGQELRGGSLRTAIAKARELCKELSERQEALHKKLYRNRIPPAEELAEIAEEMLPIAGTASVLALMAERLGKGDAESIVKLSLEEYESVFVEKIRGSGKNVPGMPVEELIRGLKGIPESVGNGSG